MPTSIGDVMRADDNVDVEPSGAGPPGDPGTTPPSGASTPPPLPPGVPETVTPGAAPPGTCEPVEPCGAESPSPVCAPACDWSVDVRTVVPQPTRARLPASASRAAARARSGTPVTRPPREASRQWRRRAIGRDTAKALVECDENRRLPRSHRRRASQSTCTSHVLGAGLDRLADAEVGAAAADVPNL